MSEITLTVRYVVKGTQCTVTIDPKKTVSKLMDKVVDLCGLHGIDQVMKLDGIELKPLTKLDAYGVKDGDIILLYNKDLTSDFDYEVRIHRGDAVLGNVVGGSSSSSSDEE